VVQVSQQSLTFEMFVTQYGDDERYELIDGELIDMEPTGPLFETLREHEQVAGLINCELNARNSSA
jgi:Uma2 family endonuclease